MMRTILSILLGLGTGFAIMMGFEAWNAHLFPFPPGMDKSDVEQVRAFAASLPREALILVLAGWIVGSLVAGSVSAMAAGDRSFAATLAVGLFLTAGAVFNAWLIRHPWWFHLGGLALFLPLAFLGRWLVQRQRQRPTA